MCKPFFTLKTLSLLLLLSIVLSGCCSTSCTLTPLKDIEKYRVLVFLSPYGNLDQEAVQNVLREKLSSIGKVIKSDTSFTEETPILLLALESNDSTIASSIRVLGKVKVVKNGCQLNSVIWSYPLRPEGIAIPVEHEGKISFVQETKPLSSQEEVLDALLTAFTEEYKKVSHARPITFVITH